MFNRHCRCVETHSILRLALAANHSQLYTSAPLIRGPGSKVLTGLIREDCDKTNNSGSVAWWIDLGFPWYDDGDSHLVSGGALRISNPLVSRFLTPFVSGETNICLD